MKILLSFFIFSSAVIGFSQVKTESFQPVKPAYFYVSGYVGCLFGDAQAMTFNTGWGYHFRNGLETGLSIGRERYSYSYTYTPLLFETNYGFSEWKSGKPFAGIFGGVLLNTSPYDFNRNRTFGCVGARIGFTRHISNHLGWTTSLGYRFMQLERPMYYSSYITPIIPWNEIVNSHVIELKIGLELR